MMVSIAASTTSETSVLVSSVRAATRLTRSALFMEEVVWSESGLVDVAEVNIRTASLSVPIVWRSAPRGNRKTLCCNAFTESVWTNLAWLPGLLDRTFEEGQGWVSGVDEGFAIRHPANRLSMLYCRGRSSRQGHGCANED